ncbi:hypothetical protein Tco_0031394 [Tanacetum coccineum]
METIHVKFDELTAMASEHDCLEPELQRFINHNSSAETMNTPSKEDLDNLFGPMYEEYFENNLFHIILPSQRGILSQSTTALEPSNVQDFHQVQPSTHIWTKDHPLDQVIGDPSKPFMTRQWLHTDSEICMYATTTVSTIAPKKSKKLWLIHSWKSRMQDELN